MATTGPTERRRRQVRWAKRMRRLGRAWDNALEIARAGRLTAPYGAAFEIVHAERVYRLRRYVHTSVAAAPASAILLVPPLMVASEVYDISPDVSAVAYLTGRGVDVWLVDFGAPEREEGGMGRTLDDHVRAVAEAVGRVRAATGRDVHLCGYSQGGMFAYQAAAFRRGEGVASLVTMGSPVDLHRTLEVHVAEEVTERLVAGCAPRFAWPLAHVEGLPGVFTSTGFKLLAGRARRRCSCSTSCATCTTARRSSSASFSGGCSSAATASWRGPGRRSASSSTRSSSATRWRPAGSSSTAAAVTLADLELSDPVLRRQPRRDGQAGVRCAASAAPHSRARAMYEVQVRAGHFFGLVVGSTRARGDVARRGRVDAVAREPRRVAGWLPRRARREAARRARSCPGRSGPGRSGP